MGKFSRKDFISGLPQSITEIILTKLPIRDAVRTSTLSKKWRYQWATMTQLVFDDKSLSLSDDRQVTERELVNFITRFLLLHDGPIHKFKLSTFNLISFADLDQWLLFLSRKDVKKLVLNMDRWRLDYREFRTPSCIFSCQKLIKLKLIGFEVKPPLGFQGFPCLKSFSLCGGTVALEVVEKLISDCPLLEKIELVIDSDHALTIRAPNLKHLTVGLSFKDVYLEHTPLLVNMLMFFSEEWEGNVLPKVPVSYDCLKFIDFEGINFQKMNQVSYVLQLLLQSPNLQELEIDARQLETDAVAVRLVHHEAVALDFWKRECPADFTFKHLKRVNMSFLSNEHDLEFIKFVLGRSPVLEVMRVSPREVYNGNMNMVNEVLHFQHASPKVDIRFFD